MGGLQHSMLSIRTPEGIAFNIALAGPASRFLAWVIDTAASVLLGALVAMGISVFGILLPDISQGAMILSFFVLNIGYNIVLEWIWRGQTLGKRLLGLRVMDIQGLRLHFSQIVLRNLLRAADLLPVLYLTGGISMLLNRRNQRLGDIAANTVVVKHRQTTQPDVAQLMPSKYNSFRAYPHLEARLRQRLQPAEVNAIIQALLRREQLEPEARVRLYRQMAGHLQELAPFPAAAILGLTDEQYLRNAIETLFRRGAQQSAHPAPVAGRAATS
jgi:uncharacterized RDD family membrane protein YckC